MLLFIGLSSAGFSQIFTEESLRTKLDSLSQTLSGLNNNLQLNVSSLQLSELVNSVALENNLNISVDPSLNQLISYNFFDAPVKDMLVFLYLHFEIEYDFVGSIISIRKREKPIEKPVAKKPKEIDVSYNPANKFLSMNLKRDTLWRVTQALTNASGINFVVDPAIRDKQVNAYFMNRPHEQVLEMFAKSNELILELSDEGYYSLAKGETTPSGNPTNSRPNNYKPNSKSGDFILTKNPVGTIDIFTRNVPLKDLIQAAAEETGVHYIVYSDLQGKVNLDLKDVSL